jgi:hypothetical protein
MSVLAGRSGYCYRHLCQGSNGPIRDRGRGTTKRIFTLESAGSGGVRLVRHRSSSGAMQSPPTSSLWKLSGSALRCSLLRLRADHPHRQQDRQKRGRACSRRLAAVAVSRTLPQHAAVPKLPELPGQITLRKSSSKGPSFSTLTLSLAPPYDELACGLATGLSPEGKTPPSA